jgi:hypothetical protein
MVASMQALNRLLGLWHPFRTVTDSAGISLLRNMGTNNHHNGKGAENRYVP